MDYSSFFLALLMSIIIISLFYYPSIRVGYNYADEGYLYLGSLCLFKKLVPIRDFRAYDPGRYYWCVLWMKIITNNIMTLRFAMSLVMISSLTLFAWLLFIATQQWPIIFIATLISFVWLKPYFKAFDIFFSILASLTAFMIIYFSSVFVYFVAGIIVGSAMFFGLNLALYVGLTTVIAISISLLTSVNEIDLIVIPLGITGLGLGLSPSIIMLIKYHGYFRTYWDKKIKTLITRGSTNLYIPLSWLWVKDTPQFKSYTPKQKLFFKAIFTLIPIVYIFSILWSLLTYNENQITSAVLMAASIAGLTFFHHASSRADASHILQSTHPFIIVITILLSHTFPDSVSFMLLSIFLGISLWATAPKFDFFYAFMRKPEKFQLFETNKEYLWLPNSQFKLFQEIRSFTEKYSKPGSPVLYAPSMPGFYPIFDREPALYDTYSVHPASKKEQEDMIKVLDAKKIPLAVIIDVPRDGREDLRYSLTHPLVWRYLHDDFEIVHNESENLPEHYYLFNRKQGT